MTNLGLLLALICVFQICARDRLSVVNNTPQEVYGAFYYSINGPVMKRASCVYAISTHQERVIPIQKYLPNVFTRFVVAPKKSDLKEYVYTALAPTVYSRYFDPLVDMSYVVTRRNGLFFIYNQDEWKQVREILQIKEPKQVGLLRNKIKRDFVAFRDNPYKYTVAHVRKGNELSVGEKKAVKNRIKRVKKALENKFKKDVSYVPKISLVTSGGGYRAMIMSTGFLVAAEEIGLKDMITWWATCSGSGWGAAAYYTMENNYEKSFGQPLGFYEFRKEFFDLIKDVGMFKLFRLGTSGRLMANARLVSWASNEPVTLVEYYGIGLAAKLLSFFGDDRHRQYLSQLASLVESGEMIPIWTAIDEPTEKIWYEFTPWEFGTAWDNYFIPMWGLGREYKGGYSIDFNPEKNFDFIIGVTGSALTARLRNMYKDIFGSIKEAKGFLPLILKGKAGLKRVTWTEVFNYTREIMDAYKYTFLDKNKLESYGKARLRKLVDAAIAANLPYPPVSGERSGRKADIFIFFDASRQIVVNSESPKEHALKYAEKYAREKGLKFPKINYDRIDHEPVSIFKDEQDRDVPVVIYIPRQNNPKFWPDLEKNRYKKYASYLKNFDLEAAIKGGYADTFNFKYSFDQAMQLSYVSEFNLHMIQDQIFKEIEILIGKKSK